MNAKDIIDKYMSFFEGKGHVRIPNSPLVPENDPTTLFTSSGMQPLVSYLLGEQHPAGKRLVNVQNSFRAQDIDEIGDNRHTTFFRMLGNWSLGDYFKSEEIRMCFEFLTKELNINPEKLYVTVFDGFENIPKDTESEEIWRILFESVKLNPDERIFFYGADKNWWSRSGEPKDMPMGEPGGPDTEVFYQFDVPHDEKLGKTCHPNCQCGRYLEIANSVFMQYKKSEGGPESSSRSPSGTIRTRLTGRSNGVKFVELPQKNVDFGGGLERLIAATENQQDIFQTSLLSPIVETIETITNKDYESNSRAIRIIADHLIASTFIAGSGVVPSNKEQGYILRRLLRRSIRYGKQLGANDNFTAEIARVIIKNYSDTDPWLNNKESSIIETFKVEKGQFAKVLEEGVKKSEKIVNVKIPISKEKYSKIMQLPDKSEVFRNVFRRNQKGENKLLSFITRQDLELATISGKEAFDLYQSFGFPIEMIIELAQEKNLFVDVEDFSKEIKLHQDVSRAGAKAKFAGGLADHSELTIKGHTATHLLHQALRDVLGESVYQTGSNITTERIRFDFNFDRKLTEDEIRKVENTVQKKIKENLPVYFEIMPLAQAKNVGAIGLFDEKYQDKVKVYFVGGSRGPYSIEFCGGPHVDFTGRIKSFKIIKEESLGKNNIRIYAIVE